MARTIRNITKQCGYVKWLRTPRYKHKLLAGESIKTIVDDWSDKPVAGNREMKHKH